MNTKLNYFNHRVSGLGADPNRRMLGEREVKTLLTVLDFEDRPEALRGKLIVDLGCGDQHLREPFENRRAIYRGIDINECNLESEKIPIEDNTCDIAISMAVIEHLRDPSHFMAEIYRLLKPGGFLWLETPDIKSCGNDFWNDPTHLHPYTRNSIKTLLLMSGFNSVLITPNYRCKPRQLYTNCPINFFLARYVMIFSGLSELPLPSLLKGKCTGLFALSRKSI